MFPIILGATALLLTAIAAQAQGIVSPVANPQSKADVVADPVAVLSPVPTTSGNPFKPAQPSTAPTVDPNLPPPPPPVDPAIAAIAEEMISIREKGERVGVIDGKVIFRLNGRYLIEALASEVGVTAPIDSSKREAALAGECVIRVVTESTPAANKPAAEQNKTR